MQPNRQLGSKAVTGAELNAISNTAGPLRSRFEASKPSNFPSADAPPASCECPNRSNPGRGSMEAASEQRSACLAELCNRPEPNGASAAPQQPLPETTADQPQAQPGVNVQVQAPETSPPQLAELQEELRLQARRPQDTSRAQRSMQGDHTTTAPSVPGTFYPARHT